MFLYQRFNGKAILLLHQVVPFVLPEADNFLFAVVSRQTKYFVLSPRTPRLCGEPVFRCIENYKIMFFFRFTFSLYILIFAFFILIPSIASASEEDPLKDMDLNSLTEEIFVEEKAKLLFISGYLESRNPLRIKEMDEPISLRQRLWLDCFLGQDWIRGFASAYFDHDPAVRDWTDDNDELYYVELNEAYLTIDTERIDFILGKKMMRWGTGDGINPMDLINPRDYRDPIASARADARLPIFLANGIFLLGACYRGRGVDPKTRGEFPLPDSPWEPGRLRDMRRSAKSGSMSTCNSSLI